MGKWRLLGNSRLTNLKISNLNGLFLTHLCIIEVMRQKTHCEDSHNTCKLNKLGCYFHKSLIINYMNQIKKNGFLRVLIKYECDKQNIVSGKYFGGRILKNFQESLLRNKSWLFARRLLDRKHIKKLSYYQQKRQQYLHQSYDGVECGDTYIINYIK